MKIRRCLKQKLAGLGVLIALIAITCSCIGQNTIPVPLPFLVTVPKKFETTKSHDASEIPFGTRPEYIRRYQQVFDSSQFPELGTEGAFLYRIFVRPGCNGLNNALFSNIVFRVSTTTNAVDHLSNTFAENVGKDEVTFAAIPIYAVEGADLDCARGGNLGFGDPVDVQNSFLYRPTDGNLLLDITLPTSRKYDTTFQLLNETVRIANDPVSRIAAFSPDAKVADVADTEGLVCQFQFLGIPKLVVSYETNNVILIWPSEPHPTRLQMSTELREGAEWKDYNGTASDNTAWRTVILPHAALANRQFFRLLWGKVN